MTAYCTADDIRRRLGDRVYSSIVYRPGTMIPHPDLDIDVIISNSMSIMDIYLRKYYVLPISSDVPYVLTNICVSLCVYYIYDRVGQAEMKPDVKSAYDQAIAQLEQINKLQLILDIPKTSPKIHYTTYSKHIGVESESDSYI